MLTNEVEWTDEFHYLWILSLSVLEKFTSHVGHEVLIEIDDTGINPQGIWGQQPRPHQILLWRVIVNIFLNNIKILA
jgi:hypothetical protein